MEGALNKGDLKARSIFTPFGIVLFILSLGYIGAEAIFNMQLLDVAGTVKSNPDEIQRLQHFGRSVSAYGFSLLTLGAFAGSGFRLQAGRYWFLFGILTAISFIPLILRTQQAFQGLSAEGVAAFHDEPLDMQFCALPFLGLALVFLSAGKFRVHLLIGLVLMAWPAMYLGQKLIIERYIVDRTDWEERQNARYMLMLRAGLEDCKLELGGLQFCDSSRGAPDMKAARIVISTLWMLSPGTVLGDLQAQRDQIVENAATAGMWFSPQVQYEKYVKKVEQTRGQYVQELSEKYYKPYKQASDLYMKALDPAGIQEEADKAAGEVEDGIDEGWQKYQAAVRDYRQSLTVMAGEAMRQVGSYAGAVNTVCRYADCPDIPIDVNREIKDARERGEREFYDHSGYHTDIRTRAEFVTQPPTQAKIRKRVEGIMREKYNEKDFTLPADWVYEVNSFKDKVKTLIQQKIEDSWKKKSGKLPPGLDEAAFMAVLGIEDIPTVDKLVMSEEEFYKKVIVPGQRKMADEMVADLARDKAKYPLHDTNMQEGKDYAEAMYIPTISLVISLTVVVLTLLRGFMALMELVLKSGGGKVETRWLYIGRGAAAACFIGLLLSLPHIFPNPYASGVAYERYFGMARQKHPAIAPVLDWAVQVQPVIYRLGRDIRRITG